VLLSLQLDDEFDFPPSFVELFKLLMQVLMVGHFFACLWMFITLADQLGTPLSEVTGNNWWISRGFDPHEPLDIYVASLYVCPQRALLSTAADDVVSQH
jgi:hypothetical protein